MSLPQEPGVGVGISSTASASVALAENAQAAAIGDSTGDPAWKYCTLPDKSKKYQLKCNFCKQLCSGGITRIKYHLAHIPKSGVAKCGKVPTDVKNMMYELLTKNKAKKKNKCKEKASARAEVNLSDSESEGESSSEEEGGNSVVVLNPGRAGSATSSKGGPMERFCKPTIEDATAAKKRTSLSNKVQTKLSTQKREERRDRACEYISQFFYEASIPHNVVNLPSFDLMLEAIGDFGRYLKGPSAYELSGPLLKKAKDKMRDSFKKHKEQWALTGCSLMTDAWTDKKGRGVMNLVVHSNYGVHFVDSVDCSSVKKDGKYIFDLVIVSITNFQFHMYSHGFNLNIFLFPEAKWWLNHGTSSPNLRKLAIRILSLTCSSSACERNWSVFEQVHSKRRVRLLHNRMRDLVFVKFNSRLKHKKENKRRDPIEKKVADIIEDEDNEWITGVVANVEQLQDPEAEGAQKQDGVVPGHGKRKKVVCTLPRKRTRKIVDITEGNEDEPELDSSSDTEDDDHDNMAESLSDHYSDYDHSLSED